MARTCALLTKNRVFRRGEKVLSPYVERGKNFFRFLGFGKKHLRAFGEQMYHTTVLYNRLGPEFKPLQGKRLRQKDVLKRWCF
jgi:hypothetical protein